MTDQHLPSDARHKLAAAAALDMPEADPCESRLTGGRSKPCSGCPWIVGNADASKGCEGQHDHMAGAFSGEKDFYQVMACHTRSADDDAVCIGYLLSDHAADNATLDVLITRWDPDAVERCRKATETAGIEVHATYAPMRQALIDHWGFV